MRHCERTDAGGEGSEVRRLQTSWDGSWNGDGDARARGATFVVREVPARVCPNCGEEYVDPNVAAELLRTSGYLSRNGSQFDVRRYAAA
jgi:hypothetical protein